MSAIDRPDAKDVTGFVRPSVAASHTYHVPAYEGITAKLNQNECPFDLPDDVKEHLLERFRAEPWNRYPDEFGAGLRTAIAERLDWSPNGVLLGNGSNELAQFLAFALIEPGTPVALLDPMFALFAKLVALNEGQAAPVRCRGDLTTDPETCIEIARRREAPLTIVATPNNPTGRAIPFEGLRQIAEGVPGLLLIDEAYHEFVDDPPATALLSTHPNVLVLRTLSKTVGIAGLRLGYLLADPAFVSEILKARLPFMVNRLTAVVADYVIRHPELVQARVEILRTERDEIIRELSLIDGVTVFPSSANFVIFKTPLEAAVLEQRLAERSVLVRDISGYEGLDRFVRVNAGLPPENKAFLSALKNVLSSS